MKGNRGDRGGNRKEDLQEKRAVQAKKHHRVCRGSRNSSMWLDATVCGREQQKGNSRVRSEGWSYNQEESAFLINSECPELKLSGSGKLRRAPKLGCHPLWPPPGIQLSSSSFLLLKFLVLTQSNSPALKNSSMGIPWQSSGQDSALPLQEAQVQSLVMELRSCNLHGAT